MQATIIESGQVGNVLGRMDMRAKFNELGWGEFTRQAKWTVKITTQYGSASFNYSMGLGIKDATEQLDGVDVLYCLLSDYRHYVQSLESGGYGAFLWDFGGEDTPERRKTWRQLQRNSDKMVKLFGADELEDMDTELREMGY